MRVSARGFAILLWLIAAFVLIVQWVRYLANGSSGNGWLLLGLLAVNLMYVGALAGLGAIVHLLGEIRDQLGRRQ